VHSFQALEGVRVQFTHSLHILVFLIMLVGMASLEGFDCDPLSCFVQLFDLCQTDVVLGYQLGFGIAAHVTTGCSLF